MRDASRLNDLGLDPRAIEAAQQISPYSREGVDELRMLGIRSGLIRVRDQGNYISVQFDVPADTETTLLRFVHDFFESTNPWRPYVRIGNLRTNSETTYSWQELLDRLAEPRQNSATEFPLSSNPMETSH